MLFSIWVDRWPRIGNWLVIMTLIVSLFSSWLLYLSNVGTYLLHNALALSVAPVLLMMALYWVKWWAVKLTRTWINAFYSQENPPVR